MPKTVKKRKMKFKKTKKNFSKKIKILQNFEGSNITTLSKKAKNGKIKINLKIKKEPYKTGTKRKFQNWFYFKVSSVKQKTIEYEIHDVNNYDDDWKGFNVCYSYDNIHWKRTKTSIKTKKNKANISWKFKSNNDSVWFAYYPPYSFEKVKQTYKGYKTIGRSEKNRPILMKKIGTGKTKVWIISGQHPGETVNMWVLEGFLERLSQKKSLLNKCTFFIVPCLNPDGKAMGHWYLNAKGVNLNRDWGPFKSKETQSIRRQFLKHGFDLVIDLHGDEGANRHFLAHSPKKKHPLHDEINQSLNNKNKNFQLENYYIQNNHSQTLANTLDEFTTGITLEVAMKHKLNNHKTLQDESIQIGRELLDSLPF